MAVNAATQLPGLMNRVAASPQKGESEFAIPQAGGNAAASVTKVLSPLSAIFSGFGRFFGGIKNAFRSPKAFIAAVIMFASWFFVAWAQKHGKTNTLTDLLGKFTYADGQQRRGLGAFWGLFGMGTVSAAYGSLLCGGAGRMVSGGKAMFSKGFGFGSMLCGVGCAAFAYKLFTGGQPNGMAVAVSGIVLAVQAAGMNSGYLHGIGAAFSKFKGSGGRTSVAEGRYSGFFIGMTAGYAAAAALSYKVQYSYIIPLAVIIIGMVINLIIKPKKEEAGT